MSLIRAMKALSTMSMAMLISSTGQACETGKDESFEHMISFPKDVKRLKGDVDSYPFEATNCVRDEKPGNNVAATEPKKKDKRNI